MSGVVYWVSVSATVFVFFDFWFSLSSDTFICLSSTNPVLGEEVSVIDSADMSGCIVEWSREVVDHVVDSLVDGDVWCKVRVDLRLVILSEYMVVSVLSLPFSFCAYKCHLKLLAIQNRLVLSAYCRLSYWGLPTS